MKAGSDPKPLEEGRAAECESDLRELESGLLGERVRAIIEELRPVLEGLDDDPPE